MEDPSKSADLLTEGIREIQRHESIGRKKLLKDIKEELARAINRKRSTIDYYLQRHIPKAQIEVERLAREVFTRGHLSQKWLEAFMESAGYPNPEQVIPQETFQRGLQIPRKPQSQYRSLSDIIGVDEEVKTYLEDLRNLPQPNQRGDLFAVEKCIELVRCPNYKAGWSPEQLGVRLDTRPLELLHEFSHAVERWRSENPNSPDRRRFSLQNVGGEGLIDSPSIELEFRPTRFSEVFAVQQILNSVIKWGNGEFQTPRERFYSKLWRLGESPIPNLFTLHVVAVTSDDRIIVAQRSEHVRYFPGRWTVSFEEQLAEEDFASTTPIHAAVVRGVNEELGVIEGVNFGDVSVLSIFLNLKTSVQVQ